MRRTPLIPLLLARAVAALMLYPDCTGTDSLAFVEGYDEEERGCPEDCGVDGIRSLQRDTCGSATL